MLAPALAAVLLALPTARWGYLWDDYALLGRGHQPLGRMLLPDAGILLYRPISRELYFWLLARLGSWGPFAAHALQGLLLAAATFLLARFARRLAGPRAGVAAGFAFAGLYATPLLVGWVSAAQDLLAIFCVLAAVELHQTGRRWLAPLLFAAALLSKETAIALLPALLLLDWASGRGVRASWRDWAGYGAVAVAWAAVHPGIRYLAAHAGAPGAAPGYLSPGSHERVTSVVRSFLSLANIPFQAPLASLSRDRLAGLAAALALLSAAFARAWSRRAPRAEPPPRRGRILAYAAILALPPLALTSLLVGHWAPYYVCAPALGGAPAVGALLSRIRSRWVALGVAAVLLGLGMTCRTMRLDPATPNEQGLDSVDRALRRTREAFLRVCPAMPAGATAYVSVGATGQQGVYVHLHELQALRVWYDDPTLVTRSPERRTGHGGPEFLFRVPADGSVIRVDLATHQVTSSEGEADEAEVLTVVRSYAIGLAGAGEADRAVRLLTGMPTTRPLDRNWNERLAALLLLASGRAGEARSALRALPPLPEEIAYGVLFGTLSVRAPGLPLEEHAQEAFGFAPSDTTVLRAAIGDALRLGYDRLAPLLARRMLEFAPGDPESREIIDRLGRLQTTPVPLAPIVADSL